MDLWDQEESALECLHFFHNTCYILPTKCNSSAADSINSASSPQDELDFVGTEGFDVEGFDVDFGFACFVPRP